MASSCLHAQRLGSLGGGGGGGGGGDDAAKKPMIIAAVEAAQIGSGQDVVE